MGRAMQMTLDGGVAVAGDVVDRVIALLEDYPDARDSYDLAIALYHWEYDGADRLGVDLDRWVQWCLNATSDKTIWNRVQDVQKRWRPDLGPSETEAAKRVRQATQGVVR